MDEDKFSLFEEFKRQAAASCTRDAAIQLLRAWGFQYKDETERTQIYKHSGMDYPITISRKGDKLPSQYTSRIIAVISDLIAMDNSSEGGD